MFLTLVTLSLLGDVAPGPFKRPPPPTAQCQADSECVLSTFSGCCGSCCGSAPHAVPRGVNESARCAAVDCAMPDCAAVRCARAPDASEFVPACRAGRCVAVPKVEAPAQCRVNQDCSVVAVGPPAGAACHRSPCGCCPVSQALPVDSAVPLQKRPADTRAPPSGKPADKPDFGLSTGGVAPPQAPSCSPCPAPVAGDAVCQAGRCVFFPRPIVRPEPRPPG